MLQPPFINGEFYHVYNRGVDKRTIFKSHRDFERFVIALFLFNDVKSRDYDLTTINLRGLTSYPNTEKLVDVVQWSLMKNHFHFLLRQRVDGGISLFMQKVGTGYTLYFNKKHERSGRLFQGTFKAKRVKNDEHFIRLASYIPLNPLELYFHEWERKGVPPEETSAAKQYLRQYIWTSYNDYFFEDLIPGFISKKVFFKAFGSHDAYKKYIDFYLKNGVSDTNARKDTRLNLVD